MMSPHAADRFAGVAAAYVHIPFCSAVCPYCDFAVVAGQDHLVSRYIDAVVAEIAAAEPWRPLDAVYFGGGTPSHIDPSKLGMVLDALDSRHGIASDAEVSVEVNPEDFGRAGARRLRSLGFSRISFGAQSFDSGVLTILGRRHDPARIERSVQEARDAGFENLSMDLIYGTVGETDESWANTLTRAIALEPEHVSCYALTVEPGTPLAKAVSSGAAAPDPDVQADRHAVADTQLGRYGYERYEVSNWAQPGRECRYNLTVWAQGEYEAYGNGAHGFRHGRRYRNHRRLEAYLDRVESHRSPRAGEDVIEGWGAELDRLFVGLRRTVGVAGGPGTEALAASPEGRRLLAAGVIEEEGGRIRVLKPMLTDAVHRSVLAQRAPIVSVDQHA